MDEKNMIEQAEAEAQETEFVIGGGPGEPDEASQERKNTGSLDVDTVRCIAAERERISFDTGERYNSGFESYGVLTVALEKKTAVEKDLKDAIKSLWEAVKEEDATTTAAYMKEIERVARRSAMAWMHVAAIAQKAEASL
jgi:hypothetical protein